MAIKLLQNKLPWYPLDRGLGRPQNLSILVKRIISALIRNQKPIPLSSSSYHRHYRIWAKKCKICHTMRQAVFFFLATNNTLYFPWDTTYSFVTPRHKQCFLLATDNTLYFPWDTTYSFVTPRHKQCFLLATDNTLCFLWDTTYSTKQRTLLYFHAHLYQKVFP